MSIAVHAGGLVGALAPADGASVAAGAAGAIGSTGLVGESAALAAAAFWVATAMVFTAASRRVGAFTVNATRIVLALGILLVLCRVRFGAPLPAVSGEAIVLFAVSGVVGLAIGDQCFFASMLSVGPRVATLIGTTFAPIVAAALAWPILDEPLAPLQLAGMAVTLAGIVVVVLERGEPVPRGGRGGATRRDEVGDGRAKAATTATGSSPIRGASRPIGLLLAAAAGACQGSGLVLSKMGMGHDGAATVRADLVDPWIATTWRMLAAASVMVLIVGVRRGLRFRRGGADRLRPRPIASDRRRAAVLIGVGTLLGPVSGVWLSMVAVDRAEAGPAATIMATTPILILPVVRIVERERIGGQAIVGAAVAVAGVAILAFAGAG